MRDNTRKFFPMPLGSTSRGWHELEPMTRCPKEYQYARVRGVRRHQENVPKHFAIGGLLHVARAQWFYDGRQGDLWLPAMKRYIRRLKEEKGEEIMHQHLVEAVRVFRAYVAYWALRPNTEVLAIEYEMGPREVGQSKDWKTVRDQVDGLRALKYLKRTARADSIERYPGQDGVWIGECKSVYAGGRGRLADTYALHGQILMLASLYGPKEEKRFGKLLGVLLDPMVKGNNTRRPTGAPRIPITMDAIKHAMKWFPDNVSTWAGNTALVDWNAEVPRNLGTCMRPTGPCEFRALCGMGRQGAIGYELADGTPLLKFKPDGERKRFPWE